MQGDIELDDIQVVEVTGRSHRDRQRRSAKRGCQCNPSLRATTILIFVCIGIVYVVGVAIGNILMFNSLENLDMRSCNTSINRLAMLIEDDMVKLRPLTETYSVNPFTFEALFNLINYPDMDPEAAVFNLTINLLNNTQCFDEKTGMPTGEQCYGVGSEINYWALLDAEYNTKYAVYYPKGENDPGLAGVHKVLPPPDIYPSVYKAIVKELGRKKSLLRMVIPNDHAFEPMIISVEPIPDRTNASAENLGYLTTGRCILPRMKQFSDDVPSCITMQKDKFDTERWDDFDREMFAQVKAGSFGENKTYGGEAVFTKREAKVLQKSQGRICPSVPLFNATTSLMTGYINLCGFDPEKYENASCVMMRLDRPMSMVDQGTLPVVSLSAEIIGMMIILCVIFVFFLDCVVLRRIVNLSNVIRKQTRGHANALKDEDETTATMSAKDDNKQPAAGKSGKSSKGGKSASSASGTSENSHTTNSSDGGGAAPRASARDEIGNLKRAMEQNALGLRKRLEAVNDSIKIEQQKTIRHKQAMQLLNLWCGRKDYFPGLRPNAMQLRYEPTRNLDDLLANPLAIEYLKSHCESDRTLENLWFILDVSWLQELETAEDNEEDKDKRAQIHDVAVCAAKTIMQRYIAVNAPQQINISAGTYKKLREKGEHYARRMFDEAVSEVKLMLNTDILPRFQKSAAYSAMSETLFIDSSGGGDESEFSDETVSTAGSILTDEGEEGEGGVAHVFAHTFKNLHTAFEVGHDDNSSTYSASSSHATNTASGVPSASLAAGTVTTNTNTGGKGKDASSVTGSDDSDDEPEPPKLKDEPKKEEPKKEEPKKEEPKKESGQSSDSSDSSSNSISSDSMTESSSGSDSD